MPVRHEATLRIARVLRQEGLLDALLVPLDATGAARGWGRGRLGKGLAGKLGQWSHDPPGRSGARMAELATAADFFLRRQLRRAAAPHLVQRWRQRALDRSTARLIQRRPPAGFIGIEAMSPRALGEAAAVGARVIVFARTDIWGVNSAARRLAEAATDPAQRREILGEADEAWEAKVNAGLAIANGVLVESERMREAVTAAGAEPAGVTVLRQGVDLRLFRFAERDYSARPLRVVLVGRVGHTKGVLQAAETVRVAGDAVERLTVVGWDIASAELLRNETPWVRYTGGVRTSEVVSQLAAADVFLLPTFADSMARSVLEAMATGLPVITSPESGYEGVIREGVEGFLAPADEPGAMAARLRQLAESPEHRRKMGAAARARAEEFSWERFEERFRCALYSDEGAFGGLGLVEHASQRSRA